MEQTFRKRVCIIGAGPRGLVAIRHLSESKDIEVVCFEAKEEVGGVWFAPEPADDSDQTTDVSKTDENYNRLYHCPQAFMYESLTTNIPYFFMEFKDLGILEMERDIPQFIHFRLYQKYLKAYADKFKLRDHIQFNTLVKSVRLYKNLSEQDKKKVEAPRRFLVTTVNSHGHSIHENEKYQSFDYIIVVNGQYKNPYIPDLSGIKNFTGNTIHYKDFRSPNEEIFRRKRVLVLGAAYSAIDMLVQFLTDQVERSEDIERLILCSRSVGSFKGSSDFKPYIESGKLSIHQGQVLNFKDSNIACFSDGTEEKVDTIIYATGYRSNFPFLDFENDKIIDHNTEKNRGAFYGPLYKKFIAIREPNMFFLGLLGMTALVHIIPELQALTVRYIIEGKIEIPSKEEMTKSFEQEVEDHLKNVGSLMYFYKANLSAAYPNMVDQYEHVDWLFYRNWIKSVYPNDNEQKWEEFYKAFSKAKEALSELRKQGNHITAKEHDYYQYFPRELRNTSEFA